MSQEGVDRLGRTQSKRFIEGLFKEIAEVFFVRMSWNDGRGSNNEVKYW